MKGADTVFHCFRKNAATALERARVLENEAVQILGHKKMTMSYGLYSDGLELPALAQVVEAIKYPGLDLSAFYNSSCVTNASSGKCANFAQTANA